MNELTLTNTDNAIVSVEHIQLDNHPVAVYLSSLTSVNSRRAMSVGLKSVLSVVLNGQGDTNVYAFSFWTLDYQHVTAIRNKMLESGQSAAKINQALSALRGVSKQAYRLGLITAEQYHRLSDVENVKIKGLDAATGRQIKADEITALLADCDGTTLEGARDAAIIVLGVRGGLRRSEIAGLERADYDRNTGRITVHKGKGRKDRTVYLANKPKEVMDAWIDVRGNKVGKLFGRIIRGQSDLTGLTAQTVMNILNKHTEGASIIEPLTPHDMRRTFIGDALDAGIDLATVADLAGHASTDTTRRYDRRGEERKERAAKKLDL